MFTYLHNSVVYIAVRYNAGQNKECHACKLDVQFALKRFSIHDQTLDAVERSLGVGMQLPGIPVLLINDWFAPEQKYYALNIRKAADLVKFTQLVVCANICFVARDA